MRTRNKVVLGAAATAAGVCLAAAAAERAIDASPALQRALLDRLRRRAEEAVAEENAQITWGDARVDLSRRSASFRNVVLSHGACVVVRAERVELRVAPLWHALLRPSRALQGVSVHGVRAVVDARSLVGSNPTPAKGSGAWNWTISSARISDAQITVLRSASSTRGILFDLRKFECGPVRSRWLVHDLLFSTTIASGSIDGSPFELQKKKRGSAESEVSLRIERVNVDIGGPSAPAPVSWLRRGTADLSVVYRKTSSCAATDDQGLFSAQFELAFRNLFCRQRRFPDPSMSLAANAYMPLLVRYFNKQHRLLLSFGISLPLSKFEGAQNLRECGLLQAFVAGASGAFPRRFLVAVNQFLA